MKCRGVAQFGRALGSGPRGRVFKSHHSDHRSLRIYAGYRGFWDFVFECETKNFNEIPLYLPLLILDFIDLLGYNRM